MRGRSCSRRGASRGMLPPSRSAPPRLRERQRPPRRGRQHSPPPESAKVCAALQTRCGDRRSMASDISCRPNEALRRSARENLRRTARDNFRRSARESLRRSAHETLRRRPRDNLRQRPIQRARPATTPPNEGQSKPRRGERNGRRPCGRGAPLRGGRAAERPQSKFSISRTSEMTCWAWMGLVMYALAPNASARWRSSAAPSVVMITIGTSL